MAERKFDCDCSRRVKTLGDFGQHRDHHRCNTALFNCTRQHGHVTAAVGSTGSKDQQINLILAQLLRELDAVALLPSVHRNTLVPHERVVTFSHGADNALTRAWTIKRSYRRERDAEWNEYICSEDNRMVTIGNETYRVSDDGFLTPTRRGQPAPDLKYFPNRR